MGQRANIARIPGDDLSGTVAGRFVIERLLGAGGMGEVYLAQDVRLHRPVALKRLSSEVAFDPVARERLHKEAQRSSRLTHANIAALYDVVEHNGESLLVMEYVEGTTLRAHVGQVDAERFLPIAIQCAAALNAAYKHGIVHHDIKPANIMLTDAGDVKVFDFGIARRAATSTEVTATQPTIGLSGTPAYMAPEVLREEPADGRADIFSLGVVFYELLTGKNPFYAETFAGTVERIITREPAPLRSLRPDITPDIERIVSRMLMKDPALRYATAADLLADLRSLQHGSSAEIVPPPARRRCWRRQWIIAILTAVAFVSILALPAIRTRVSSALQQRMLPERKHIAVLPFDFAGADAHTVAFARGLSETLSARLAQAGESGRFHVVAPSELRDQNVTTAQQARDSFGANLVLAGTLRTSGDRIRITYTLVDTSTSRELMGDTITAASADPFDLEDRVAESMARILNLGGEAPAPAVRGTTLPAAYDFYLQGRGYLQDYHKPENLDNAEKVFQQALQLDSNYALAYAGLGSVYWYRFDSSRDQKWLPQALNACRKAVALSPNLADGYNCLGAVYNGSGQYEDAAGAYQKAISLAPSEDRAYRGLAEAYQRLQRFEEAEKTYRAAIALRPDYWAGYNMLGNFYFRRGRYNDAEQMYREVVRLEPDNVRGYGNLGAVLIELGRYADAIPVLTRSNEIHPTADSLSNLATAYFYLHRFDEAARHYEQATQLNASDHIIWGNLGDCYFWIAGKQAESRNAYGKAITLAESELKLDPRQPIVWGDLARYHAMIGEAQQAHDAIRHGLALPSPPPDLFQQIAIAYNRLGDSDRTLAMLDRAVQAGYSVTTLRNDPVFNNLHDNPRFTSLTQSAKVSAQR